MLIGSDGTSLAPYGVTGQGKPHPRFYGTFVRVLGHYARDLGLLSLPQAIHKMSGGSASVSVSGTTLDGRHPDTASRSLSATRSRPRALRLQQQPTDYNLSSLGN